MGSKKTPAPDPAQQELARAQAAAMKDQQGFNKEQFAWMQQQALQQQQRGDEEFAWQRGLADESMKRSAEDRAFFYDTTGKQTKKFSDQVDAYDTSAERDKIGGRAIVDIESAMDRGRQGLGRDMAARGLNAGAPAAIMARADMNTEGALAKGAAATMAQEAARREGLQLRAQAAGLGSMFGGMSSSALGDSSSLGMRGLEASGTGINAMGKGISLYNQGGQVAQGWGSGANDTFNSVYMQNARRSQSGQNWAKVIGGAINGAMQGGSMGGAWGAVGGGIAGGLASS